MQGRLLPARDGRIQAFPAGRWREEFPLARVAGLHCIEWIFDDGTDAMNPVGQDRGIDDIRAESLRHGVSVESICADYYMSERLIDQAGQVRVASADHLRWLLARAARVGCRYIVLPFVDSSSLRSDAERRALPRLLASLAGDAERAHVELHIESDLPPNLLAEVLAEVGHRWIRANYDIGNSASLGRDPAHEINLLGSMIGSVHVKDRMLGGGTVPFGTGAADFETCFQLLRQIGYDGPYILQAARQPGIDEVALAAQNRRFVMSYLGSQAIAK